MFKRQPVLTQAMQHDIARRQPDFEGINIKAQHLKVGESKMATDTTQLMTRYHTLKNNIKVRRFVRKLP